MRSRRWRPSSTSYWENRDFASYDAAEFEHRTRAARTDELTLLSPVEIELRPFQEALLEHVDLARHQVSSQPAGRGDRHWEDSDGSGRLRPPSRLVTRSRLLFVAHREEIIDQSRATSVTHSAMRLSVSSIGRHRPELFEHVFASIQSLNSADVRKSLRTTSTSWLSTSFTMQQRHRMRRCWIT